MREICPNCGHLLVTPNGPIDSDILIVGEFPGVEEIEVGLPFVGKTGDVLAYELAVAGITLQRCRVTNLWLHGALKPKHPLYTTCFNMGVSAMMQELMIPHKGILFLGSEIPPLFELPPVTTISGLIFDHVPVFNVPCTCMFLPNPAIVFHSTVGEIRHGLYVFSRTLKGQKVYPDA